MYNNLFTYVFFVYPALNPFKYPPPSRTLWVWKKVYPRNLQNKRFSTPTETHPCKKKLCPDGIGKITLRGIGDGMGGGNFLFFSS